jgi:hypothetical protein
MEQECRTIRNHSNCPALTSFQTTSNPSHDDDDDDADDDGN